LNPAVRIGHDAAMSLVGRAEPLQTLVSAVTRPPALVFVEGEAGIGKSSLVTELAMTTRWVAVGHCIPLREPFPFGAVLDCLRHCAPRLAEVAELSPVTGVLAPYLPEIAWRLPAAPPALPDPAAGRHLLFRAVRDLLAALGPGVLVVEDLQWADDGTRSLLRFLLTDPPDELAIVLTYRPEDTPGGGPLGGPCRPAVRTTRIRLDPLDVSQVRTMAADLLCPVSTEFAAALHAYTAGIPFVVEEVLRGLDAGAVSHVSGSGARRLLDTAPGPVMLREAMVERLDGLSGDARLIASAAAVLGEPVDAALLDGVAAIGSDRSRAAIVEALAGTVLVEVDECNYGFRHAVGRRAVYETLPGPRRQELHARAADILRARDPLRLQHLAEHSRKAGRLADWLAYGEAAADSAAAVGDASTAIALLQRLLAEPALRSSDVDRLAAKFARVSATGLDQFDVSAALGRLLFDGRMSESIRGEIRLSLGLLLVRQSDGLEASRVELELAAGELRRRPMLAARCMAVLAQPWVGTTPVAESLAWLRKVEAAIEVCDDSMWRTALLANTLGSRMHTGDPVVWERIDRLPERVDSAGEQRELARAHCNLADACSWIGHYEKARTFLHSGLRLAADCGAPYVDSIGRSTELHLDWATGNWSGLAARAGALLDSCHDLLPVSTEASLVLGSLATAKGEWAEARRHLANTGMSTPDNAFTPVVIAAHGIMIVILLSIEDFTAAAVEADRGMELLRRKGVWTWAGELVPWAVDAYCKVGRLNDATALVAELEAALDGVDAPLSHAAVQVGYGELATARDEVPLALSHFRQAKHHLDRLPQPYLSGLVAERIVTGQLALGEHTAADGLADLADSFDKLGATRDAARCRHLSRSSGAIQHSRRGRRGYGNDLSPRERDVARLVASGATNREIAEVLFLSRRTVEQHVANVLRKLNLPSRTALTEPPS
jgi:DNA-binding CsgD family transcriptional regulator